MVVSERRFRILTCLLLFVIVFCLKGIMMHERNEQRLEEKYHYLALEREYVKNTRKYLKEQGLDNCGVMMTRVTKEDGSREYTVRIHHRKLGQMDGREKSALEDVLSQAEFGIEACVFQYDL